MINPIQKIDKTICAGTTYEYYFNFIHTVYNCANGRINPHTPVPYIYFLEGDNQVKSKIEGYMALSFSFILEVNVDRIKEFINNAGIENRFFLEHHLCFMVLHELSHSFIPSLLNYITDKQTESHLDNVRETQTNHAALRFMQSDMYIPQLFSCGFSKDLMCSYVDNYCYYEDLINGIRIDGTDKERMEDVLSTILVGTGFYKVNFKLDNYLMVFARYESEHCDCTNILKYSDGELNIYDFDNTPTSLAGMIHHNFILNGTHGYFKSNLEETTCSKINLNAFGVSDNLKEILNANPDATIALITLRATMPLCISEADDETEEKEEE